MTIKVACNKCGNEFSTEMVQEGTPLRCPKCGNEIDLLAEEKPDVGRTLEDVGFAREEASKAAVALGTTHEEPHRFAEACQLGMLVLIALMLVDSYEAIYRLLGWRLPAEFAGTVSCAVRLTAGWISALVEGFRHLGEVFVCDPSAPPKSFGLGDGVLLWFVGLTLLLRLTFKIKLVSDLHRQVAEGMRPHPLGMLANVMTVLVILGLLGWYLRLVGSRGDHAQLLMCILLLALLLVGGAWSLVVFFARRRVSSDVAPMLLCGINNVLCGAFMFGCLIMRSRYASLFTPAGVSGLIALANSALGLRIDGARYFAGEGRRAAIRHAGFLLLSAIVIFGIALTMASEGRWK